MKAFLNRLYLKSQMISHRYNLSSRVAGISFWLFAMISLYVFVQRRDFYYLLLVVENLIAAFCFLYRTEATKKANFRATIAAYVCTILPMFYCKSGEFASPLHELVSDVLLIVGVTIVTLATLDLGLSNGIQPAKRVVKTSGLYSLVNHPMYIGHSITQLSFILKNPMNAYIYPVTIVLLIYRARVENRILRGDTKP